MISTTISHYRILEKLGAGGMGVVYRAEDINLGRPVALKVLPESLAQDPGALERFQREARAAAALNNTHICTIHEIDEHEGTPFIVMELLEGQTLREAIADGPLPFERIISIGLQVTEALAAAHAKGITHRDIKPSNIFLAQGGKTKIVDFGLAKAFGGPSQDHESTLAVDAPTQTDLTATGTAPGTVAYMSPEQALGHDLDARTDLFSLGSVLYEMTTGERAFSGPTQAAVFDGILNRSPAPPSNTRDDLPLGLQEILRKSLEKDRLLRYQSAVEIHTDLQRLKRELQLESDSTVTAAPVAMAEAWSHTATAVATPVAKPTWQRPALVVGVLAVLAVLAALWLGRSKETTLSEADAILLTDFSNTTGDAVFDGTLKQALAVKLGESPYLKVFPEKGVHETLRYMNLAAGVPVTPELGQEICERRGLQAVITGDIAALGSNYVVTLGANACRSGDSLARTQVEVASKEEVLAAVGRSAADLRQQLGESLASIERFDAPVEQATTSSLEALKTFSLGEETRASGNERESIVFFKRAVELDPEFALAHARLGTTHVNVGETAAGVEYKRRAYELRDRVSERERLYITAHYHADVTGEHDREIETYELWQQTYPHDWTPHNNLAWRYNGIGQSEKALEPAKQARRLDPDSVFPYTALGDAHLRLGRFEYAKPVFDDALSRGFVSDQILLGRYQIADLEDDVETMESLAENAVGTQRESKLLEVQAMARAAEGKPSEARRTFAQAAETARGLGLIELSAVHTARGALSEALLGFDQQAVEQSQAAVAIARDASTLRHAALAAALAGEPNEAQGLIDELESRFSTHTLVQAVYAANARAALQLALGDPNAALAELRSGVPYEAAHLETIYLRGQAYLETENFENAAAEFEKIIALPGVETTSPIHTLAHLGLAQARLANRDFALAREAFEQFVGRTSSAEDGVPFIEAARSEYADLL